MRSKRKVAVTALVALIACTEQLPRPLDRSASTAPAPSPIGLDVRPANATCVARAKGEGATSNALIGLQRIPAKLDRPVEVVQYGGKLYVLEQIGRVLRVDESGASSLVADIQSRVQSGGEAGLLGIAFHPKFATNGFVYLYYTAGSVTQPPGVAFQSHLVRMKSNDGGLTLDPASEKRILTVDQPYTNHNGGTIAFGNDGFLYWGLGDGGSGGDPHGNGQSTSSLLGKILRIDVDAGDPYAIPPTNPFASGTAGKPEIYALGLRNPYRFRFDTVTGALWAGDVGQSAREEIDKVVLGGNYGWNQREGKICFGQPTCANPFLDPVVDHPRSEATSITGGVVYRGAGVPLLSGKYVYGDFGLGTLFAIPIDDAAPTPLRLDDGLQRTSPSAFAIDATGEIVFTDWRSGDLFRIVAPSAPSKPVPEMPELLSETGCVLPGDPGKPATGLVPYDVNVEQWSDGATAERHLAIPDGTVITSDAEGRLALPPGAIVMKTLRAEGRRLETQLLLRRPDASWNAYAYVWSEDQRNATLAAGATTVTLPSGRKHAVVDRGECISCHAVDVVPTIGLEAAQLDRDDVDFGGGRLGNPLATLVKLGMIDVPIGEGRYARLPRIRGFDPPERRARAYLHANCAHCHRGGENLLDLRFRTPLASMHVCNVPTSSPAGGRAPLVPQQPLESSLVRTMASTNAGRMPPLGSLLPDAEGVGLVTSWIESISACP